MLASSLASLLLQLITYKYITRHDTTQISRLIVIGVGAGGSCNSLYAVSAPHLSLVDHLFAFASVVLPLVSVPTASLRECLPAHPTRIRLLARVCEFVFLEAGHLCEAFRAAFELAGVCVRIWFFRFPAVVKALQQSVYGHTKGRSPVWTLRWTFRC